MGNINHNKVRDYMTYILFKQVSSRYAAFRVA